jgi:hypothetical protein
MRLLCALPLLALAACQVTKDDQNDTITAQYNQDIAENAAADVTNEAGNIAEDIGNDISEAADKAQTKADEVQTDDKDTNKAN